MNQSFKMAIVASISLLSSVYSYSQSPNMLRYTAPYVSSKPIIDAEINNAAIVQKQRNDNFNVYTSWVKYLGLLNITL